LQITAADNFKFNDKTGSGYLSNGVTCYVGFCSDNRTEGK